ncbi:MAG: hypothetical protein M1816_001863 [Peltula sp. TS41687]|nr:MAG: hypothetical protein M1816_001863 [Peltula sp. TS41687]
MAPQVSRPVSGLVSDSNPFRKRFSDIPSAVDVVLDDQEAVEIDLDGLPDDPTELCTLLENENVAREYWMIIVLAYAKHHKLDLAIEVLTKAVGANSQSAQKDKLAMLTCLCWLYLWKSREAPRMIPDGTLVSEARTKDYYLRQSTSVLNECSRINPSFPPLFLARGVLYLLRASFQQPSSQSRTPSSQDQSERVLVVRQAIKCFEDALRVSNNKNMLALMGKSRAQYSLGMYAEALASYQQVLSKMPDLSDPDPRIGIGCCLWQLGYKDDAKVAWERALKVNPDSTTANALLGVYHLNVCAHMSLESPEFATLYKKAMTEYIQRAFKSNKEFPLACVNFSGYFFLRNMVPTAESLARKAIEFTNINAIASDGWYLLARKEHINGQYVRALEYYKKADEARGGVEKGYLPAKFGLAQCQALTGDVDGAKFRLEKIIQQSKTMEAMTLLGTLHAEEIFRAQSSGVKEDMSNERKKAIALLEAVRQACKDPEKKMLPDKTVLLNLARLYEDEAPEKSYQCLLEVEQILLGKLFEATKIHADVEDEASRKELLRDDLPPALLNNVGCFHYRSERYEQARTVFQTALNACVKSSQCDEAFDTDAHVTTISYNLGRAYEIDNMPEEAKKVYRGILEQHQDYTDASTRLAYIALRQHPTDEGPKATTALFQQDPANLELRALYGWYLSRSKKRSTNLAEDPEQRHYKHTLQHYDKHDRYSLTGMGNLYLANAREMRRDTEVDREKRSKTYERAVEFFDKALQLDPRNAYAAQGLTIALAEDKKDYNGAIQMFVKIRDTLREASVLINIAHTYAELKQYAKAIENYEAALAKDRGGDPHILACLGRVWLMKGREEKNVAAVKRSLEYSQQALGIAKDQIHFEFNVAFVQIQLAQLLYTLPVAQRTLAEVEAAAQGLDEAIESLSKIAQSDNPPYPKNDIEQRANMGRNTMRKQLERAIQAQRDYEQKNAERLRQALEFREAEKQRLEEERRKAEEEALIVKKRIAEAREKIHEKDLILAEKRALDTKPKEDEYTTEIDSDGQEHKVKRRKGGRRKKKNTERSADEGDDSGKERKRRRGKRATQASSPETDDEEGGPKKKRKLVRKGSGKKGRQFKSDELVVESDSDAEAATASGNAETSEDEEGHVSAMEVDKEASGEEGTAGQEKRASEDKPEANEATDDEKESEKASSPPAAGAPEPKVQSMETEGVHHDKDGDGDVTMEDDAPPAVEELSGEDGGE